MRARVRSDEGRNLRFCKSVDKEAIRAVRVPRRRSGSEESEVACGRLSEANCGAWGSMGRFRLTGFLGFGRDMSWSRSV